MVRDSSLKVADADKTQFSKLVWWELIVSMTGPATPIKKSPGQEAKSDSSRICENVEAFEYGSKRSKATR